MNVGELSECRYPNIEYYYGENGGDRSTIVVVVLRPAVTWIFMGRYVPWVESELLLLHVYVYTYQRTFPKRLLARAQTAIQ